MSRSVPVIDILSLERNNVEQRSTRGRHLIEAFQPSLMSLVSNYNHCTSTYMVAQIFDCRLSLSWNMLTCVEPASTIYPDLLFTPWPFLLASLVGLREITYNMQVSDLTPTKFEWWRGC